jgi:hypothetical protein
MHGVPSNFKRLATAFAAGLLCALLSIQEAVAQDSGAYPSLSGAYKSSPQHPRVFMTQADINDMDARINSPGSFSAQNFVRLSNQIKADFAANVDWDAVYSGCDLDIYLHAFSYEPPGGYADEIRSASQLSTAMHVKSGLTPPNGAAIVASRLALYAVLVKAGVHAAPGSPPIRSGSGTRKADSFSLDGSRVSRWGWKHCSIADEIL